MTRMPDEEPDLEQASLVGLNHAFEKHIVIWLRAVEVQHTRMIAGFQQTTPSEWAEPPLFAVALRNLIRACWKCHFLYDTSTSTTFADAVNSFESAIPNARAIRDRLEHFDEYEADKGGLSVYVSNDPLGSLSLHVDEFRLDIPDAVAEAQRMASTCFTALRAVR